jgi:hypothetical protein
MCASTLLILDRRNRPKMPGQWSIVFDRHPQCDVEVPLPCQQELHDVSPQLKIRGFKSGERGGHALGPLLPIQLS